MPGDALTRRDQLVLKIQHADEPLLGHDILDRRVAALVDAHRLWEGLAVEQRSLALQSRDHALARRGRI